MLQVWLLGQFEVHVQGKRTLIPARAAQSLLAFLILTAGTPHRREKLAGMLWPDMSDESARRNLRHELWRLRKALGANQITPAEYILAEDLAIQFNPHAEYWLDVEQLEREPAPDDAVGDLISRVSLYRGELLPGFYDDWVAPERDRIQALYETRMDQLLQRLIAEQRWLTVLEWAERWLTLGHTPEAAYRALMLAHHAQGETSKVALDYERCAEALRADLDIEPSAETRALYEKMTHGEVVSPAQLGKTPAIFVQSSGTVTFLFSDIEGSTQLLDRLGPEYAKLLAEHQDLLRELGDNHNGHEIDTQGDSFFFAFFRAADAVAFATDAQRALAAHKWPREAAVRVRMGLHTGEPMLARTGYVGMDVHRAARIGAAGHGGQVLLSPSTRTLVENELPSGTELRDLGEHKLKDLRYPVHIVQLTIDGLPSEFPPLKSVHTGTEPPAPGEPPFKGLEFFDQSDADLFFGREPLVEKLAQQVRENRFLAVVVGASGSGKSSVVRAGLIPALRGTEDPSQSSGQARRRTEENWRVFVMTPTAHPLEALATVLTRDQSLTTTAMLLDDLSREPRSLHLHLRRMATEEGQVLERRPLSASPRYLLVVDQFEELFTLCHDELEREQFIDNLVNALGQGQAIAPTPHLTLVLTIRADFYAHLAQYPELRDLVAKQQEFIGPMNSEELRRAIGEPAKLGHWEFEPGLVDLFLRDVGDEPGALPLLSHALLETWKRRSGHMMTLKGYHDAGGVRGAIAHTAETTYQQLSPEQQAIARNIFLRLTELGEGTEDTRRRVEIGELESGAEDRQQVRTVLTMLADARLVTTGEHTAEVAHEALIREWPRLREWLNEDREGLKLHRNLTEAAHEWELMERDPSVLYRGARLAQAKEWASTNQDRMNDMERGFLAVSVENEIRETREREEQQERELAAARKLAETEQDANKRLRRRALLLAGAFVLALVLAGVALFFGNQANRNAEAAQENARQEEVARGEAEKENRKATARELAASAISNLGVDPERSILLALEAVRATKDVDKFVLPEAENALHRAVQSSHLMHTFRADGATPRKAAFSPDGKTVAANWKDGKVRLWDVEGGQQLLELPIKAPLVDHLYFNKDGTQLATVDWIDDTTIAAKIFDLRTGGVIKQTPLPIPVDEWWLSAFNPDWTRVVVYSSSQEKKVSEATVWDMETGELLLTLPAPVPPPPPDWTVILGFDVSYSPDGKRIAAALENGMVKIWDAETGDEVLTIQAHDQPVTSIAYDSDGTRIASTSFDTTAKVWDANTGELLLTLVGHNDWVTDFVFSQDGSRIFTVSLDRTSRVWDGPTGKEQLIVRGHTAFTEWGAMSPDGRRGATASADGTLKVWDLTPSHEVFTVSTAPGLSAPGLGAGTIAYSSDGTRIAAGMRDGTIRLWDAATGQVALTLTGHERPVHRIAFSSDGERLISASGDQTARIWDVSTGEELFAFRGHTDRVVTVAFSPDGKRAASGTNADATILVWDTTTGEILNRIGASPPNTVYSLAFSPDGSQLAAGFGDGLVANYDLKSGQPLFSFDIGETGSGVFSVAFSPDGTRLAIATDQVGAKVLDPTTGKELLLLGGTPTSSFSLVYGLDGTLLATADQNGAKVWDAATGEQLIELAGGGGVSFSVALSPDGSRLALAGDDDMLVYLLRIEELVELAKSRVTRSLTTEECQKHLHVEKCPE